MTHTTTRTHTDPSRDAGHHNAAATTPPAGDAAAGGAAASRARAALALAAGLAMLILVFANLDRVAIWAAEHGPVWVYLGFFLVMSIAGRLFWWGVDTLVKGVGAGKREASR
ncbi:hypothetical protein AB4Z09_28325 [Rhodococcus sp. TAF43]|uniref:hypothetical protein n=1 Tax=Rhodococcus sp. TAF43 TaxID=3237483 RepID=UPI003F97CA68